LGREIVISILTLQRRLREIGRIRAGRKGDKGQPQKLATWRFTSPQQGVIAEAAGRWGGTVGPWESPNGPQYEVITDTDTISVVIPTAQSISQFYEAWAGGGCTRRCDGETELLTDQPCLCDPDPAERLCKPKTRFNVMLPDLSDLGQWRLESSSWYGATELAGISDLLALANAQYIRANLRLEQRQVKRPGQPTKRFAVPVVEMDVKLGDVLNSLGLTGGTVNPVGASAVPVLDTPAYAAPRTGPSDDEWAELVALLGPDVDGAVTMPVIETGLRRVFELMDRVGLWVPNPEGTDALHLALRSKMRVDHVGDLRKEDLVKFAEMTWAGAREAVAALDEDGE